MKTSVLETIAEHWNRAGIHYAVAHGLEPYPDTVGRDLDILVPAAYIKMAIDIARNVLQTHGFTVIHPPPLWGERLVAVKDGEWTNVIEIHTMQRLSWRNVVFADYPNGSARKGPFKIDPWASFVKRILIPLLSGGTQKFLKRPCEFSFHEGELEVVSGVLPSFCGEGIAQILCESLTQSSVRAIEALIPELKKSLILRAFIKTPMTSIRLGLGSVWRKVIQPFVPCAPIIALVGPDGVGKSTLIDVLAKGPPSIFTKIIVQHWRPWLLPRLGAFVGRSVPVTGPDGLIPPRRTPGRFHWLRLGYYLVDFVLGGFLKDRVYASRQHLVLYDRCGLDMVVDPLRYGLRSAKGIRLLWRLIPKPDVVIFLYDRSEPVYTRKPELARAEIDRQLKGWLRLAEEGKVDAILRVDAPPEAIAHRLKHLIMAAFIEKNGGPISEGSDPIRWVSSTLTDGVRSRFITKDSPIRSWKSICQYSWLDLKDGRGYLIPLDSRKVAAQSLSLYSPQNFKARLAKRLLGTGLKLGASQHLLRQVHLVVPGDTSENEMADVLLLEHLRGVLGRKDLSFAISLGAPGPYRKPVLKALTYEGKTVAYVKAGWKEAVNARLQHEVDILERLAATSFTTFAMPCVVYAGWWKKRYLCVQSAPADRTKLAPRELTPQHLNVLRELATFHTRWSRLKESDFWKKLLTRIEKISNPYYRSILQQGVRRAEEWFGDTPLPFHFCHGDFTPWNTKWVDGQLFLFDWEYADWEGPIGWDLVRFLAQRLWYVKKRSKGEICDAFQKGGTAEKWIAEHMESLSMKSETIYPIFVLYLIEQLSLYALEDAANFQVLHHLAMMLNLSIHQNFPFCI